MQRNLAVVENKDGILVVNSRTIAKELNKRHSDIIKQIESIFADENVRSLVISSTYEDLQKKERKDYYLTEKGFTFYMFNIQGHNKFKLSYINEFERMKKIIKENNLPAMTEMEMISKIASSQHETLKRVETVENSVQKLENTMTIDSAKQRNIQKKVAVRVFERVESIYLESCGTWDKSQIKPKVFANIYRNLKDKFAVSSYKDIKIVDYDRAIQFIQNWIEDSDLLWDE